ncbi:MAG: tRNA (adenosine(37)-N6)-dimethylallyltransferase MiaA, partial [Elusimicrobia bacterium]|nr:tRNA (adenosine(37)-N6)-dimethylallyltransferase MiaA [Elusimicrobiota bacterium]
GDLRRRHSVPQDQEAPPEAHQRDGRRQPRLRDAAGAFPARGLRARLPVPSPLPQAAEGPALASPSVIAIVGPTASGKTALALALARRLDAELVSADSRQMYRRLDAGTDKPKGRWEDGVYRVEGIPYHLVDVFEPTEPVDAGAFAARARNLFEEIAGRGRVPVLVGGTGLYVRAALGGLDRLPRRDEAVRERLAERAEGHGRQWLHEELARVDPEAARGIPPNNLHRVIRALEVWELTGKPISSFWSKPAERAALYVGVSWSKSELEDRIRRRCGDMFPAMIDEVRRLVGAKYRGDEPAFSSLGYAEALACARGEAEAGPALESFVHATLRYAKRQATWFRNQAPVRWLASGAGDAKVWAKEAEAIWNEWS